MPNTAFSSELNGWGRYPRIKAMVLEPGAMAESLSGPAPGTRWIAHGMGRSYGDASLPSDGGVAIRTRWFDRFLSFDQQQGLVTVEAGLTLEALLSVILPTGWFLPVTPGTRFVSIGGAIASNVHGKNHHKSGAFVQCVQELSLLTETGVIVCSRTQNPDAFFATVGGYGLTGIICSATLKLRRVDSTFIKARLIKVRNLEEAVEMDLRHSEAYEYSVTWLDALAGGSNLGRGIVMLGNHAHSEGLPDPLRARGLSHNWASTLRAPPVFPGVLLNNLTNLFLNTAYRNRFFGRETQGWIGIEPWFYPLDRILDWNRFYGRTGFVEFQCSLPLDSAVAGMRAILARVRKAGLGSFLAVYKRMGHDGVTLPFALPGFTLAMDFGLRNASVLPLLDELDRIVIDHMGRVYLSKDARMAPGTFRQMYPEYELWRSTVENLSPSRLFQSRLAERLNL